MAISPREAAELTDSERAQLAEAETVVDAVVRTLYTPEYGPFAVVVSRYSDRVLNTLCRRYRVAGWAVCDWETVRRGNARITFEAGTTGDRDAVAGLEPK